MDNKQDHKKDK